MHKESVVMNDIKRKTTWHNRNVTKATVPHNNKNKTHQAKKNTSKRKINFSQLWKREAGSLSARIKNYKNMTTHWRGTGDGKHKGRKCMKQTTRQHSQISQKQTPTKKHSGVNRIHRSLKDKRNKHTDVTHLINKQKASKIKSSWEGEKICLNCVLKNWINTSLWPLVVINLRTNKPPPFHIIKCYTLSLLCCSKQTWQWILP